MAMEVWLAWFCYPIMMHLLPYSRCGTTPVEAKDAWRITKNAATLSDDGQLLSKEKLENAVRVVVTISMATIATAVLPITTVPVPISAAFLAALNTVMAAVVTALCAVMTTFLALLPTRLIVVTVAILRRLYVGSDLHLCRHEGSG
jgi:hypothetical protein